MEILLEYLQHMQDDWLQDAKPEWTRQRMHFKSTRYIAEREEDKEWSGALTALARHIRASALVYYEFSDDRSKFRVCIEAPTVFGRSVFLVPGGWFKVSDIGDALEGMKQAAAAMEIVASQWDAERGKKSKAVLGGYIAVMLHAAVLLGTRLRGETMYVSLGGGLSGGHAKPRDVREYAW